jgi:hypothetical protein
MGVDRRQIAERTDLPKIAVLELPAEDLWFLEPDRAGSVEAFLQRVEKGESAADTRSWTQIGCCSSIFGRVDKARQTTPAIAAGISNHA